MLLINVGENENNARAKNPYKIISTSNQVLKRMYAQWLKDDSVNKVLASPRNIV